MSEFVGEMRSVYFGFLVDQALSKGMVTGAIKEDHLRREMSDHDIELFLRFLEERKRRHNLVLDRVADEARLVQQERLKAKASGEQAAAVKIAK